MNLLTCLISKKKLLRKTFQQKVSTLYLEAKDQKLQGAIAHVPRNDNYFVIKDKLIWFHHL